MKLYHYTCITYLPKILETGLTRGEVVIDWKTTRNAVNLTSDRDPSGHGLCGARFLTAEEHAQKGHSLGETDPIHIFPDKRKVRITVDVQKSELTRWYRWAGNALQRNVFDGLVRSGGGMKKARTWYFHRGPIFPAAFCSIEIRSGRSWVSVADYTGPWHEIFSMNALEEACREWGPRLRVGQPDTFLEEIDAFRLYQEQEENAAFDAWERAYELGAPRDALLPSFETRQILRDKLNKASLRDGQERTKLRALGSPVDETCPPCLAPALNTSQQGGR